MVPLPVPAVVLVKTAGSPPLQIVCPVAIAPEVGMLCTVTCTGAVAEDSQATPFWVETVTLLYWVVSVNPDGALYVAAFAAAMVVQVVNGLTELSHR